MKKVLMIVMNDFVNEARVEKEATGLGRVGYDVKVLALDNGSSRNSMVYEGFELIRIKLNSRSKISSKNRFLQLIKYAEFYHKCRKYAMGFEPDIVHVHDVAPLPIGISIKKALKSQLIYDSHELWSNVNGSDDNPRILNQLRDSYEKMAGKHLDMVITVSESIANCLRDILELKALPVVVKNAPPKSLNRKKGSRFHSIFKLSEKTRIILYQGYVTRGRGIEVLIQSLKSLDNNIVLIVLGDGDYKQILMALAKELDLTDRVFFHEAVPYGELLEYTSSADLGLSIIQNVSLSDYYCLPNKMFEYVQAGVPVICSDFPDMRELVKTHGIGEVCNPSDAIAVSNAIRTLLDSDQTYSTYVKNCESAREVLSWETEERKLHAAYNTL